MVKVSLISQFLKFTGAGAMATLAHYLVLLVQVEFFDIYAVTASLIGSIVGLIVSYLLNYRYTFNSKKSHQRAFSAFVVVALLGVLLNVLIMKIVIGQIGLHYFIAQLLATGVVLLWNFAGNRLWTFHESDE